MAEPLEQGIGSADPCPSGAGKEVAAWNAPRMGTLIFTHMPMSATPRPLRHSAQEDAPEEAVRLILSNTRWGRPRAFAAYQRLLRVDADLRHPSRRRHRRQRDKRK